MGGVAPEATQPRVCRQYGRVNGDLKEGFPGDSDNKESVCNVGDLDSIPELGRSPGGRHDNPLQCFCLENPHGQRSLEGCSPWGHKELDMTERLSIAQRRGWT